MLVIPAMDLKGGRCVRLVEGREQSEKVYDRDPVEVALAYERAGARLIHVVDLDGAFLGAASANQKIIREIAASVKVPIEAGGGVRSLADIEFLLSHVGVRFCIIGTLAVEHPEIAAQALARLGDSIVVGIDARGSEVSIRGWTRAAEVSATDLARQMAELGATRIIYTDITRDGRLAGPNLEATREIAVAFGRATTASGGVSSLEDIANLCEIEPDGVDSCIVGKALYEGRFTLEEALAGTRKES
jgi:phosphoribosylformimino-5-aminoimidazole carboxamide ribotide isomerase